MKTTIIRTTTERYLSEIYPNGLPVGVINKGLADVGGTYCCVNCGLNYIIVCPTRDLVMSICNDPNNKYDAFAVYGGIGKVPFNKYMRSHEIKKLIVTYDSLAKLVNWLNGDTNYYILVDEYHITLQALGFREDAINSLFDNINKFKHVTFLSATPIQEDFEFSYLKELPHYVIEWSDETKITPIRKKCTDVVKSLIKIIEHFENGQLTCTSIDGNTVEVKELYIFINSVKSIKTVIDTCKIDDYKVCCADTKPNRTILEDITISNVINPNKKINFFTSKCFQGCNLFTNNGLIIVVSDCNKNNMLLDLSSDLIQIAGRLRFNNTYQNCFRHVLIHLYNTNSNLQNDEVFEKRMNELKIEADALMGLFSKATDLEKRSLLKKLNLEYDILSIKNDELYISELKYNYFQYLHALRKSYADGISIKKSYSKKFISTNQEYWNDIDKTLDTLVMVSYEKLIKQFYDEGFPDYMIDIYPEFEDYKKYLTIKECNTLDFNRVKLSKKIEQKKKNFKLAVKLELNKFYSKTYLKQYFNDKATVVKDFFDVKDTNTNKENGFVLLRPLFKM